MRQLDNREAAGQARPAVEWETREDQGRRITGYRSGGLDRLNLRARRSLHVHYDAPKQLAEQHALKILWFIIGQRLRNIVRGDQLMRAFGL